jgi:hypothetical protein
MSKYKQQKSDSKNQPLKKRESTPPKREDDKSKQLAVVQPVAPPQGVAPRVFHWGPPIPPPLCHNGVPMEFGCCILWWRPCIVSKGGESLLVKFQGPPCLAD